jgi:hypothetical protein
VEGEKGKAGRAGRSVIRSQLSCADGREGGGG